jgi:peptidyl carrier protein
MSSAETGSSRDIEKRVAAIWRDVLGVSEEDAGATFFELQGQSISAVRVTTRIEDELGIEIDVAVLFEDPDLASFTRAVLDTARKTAARQEIA